MYNYDDLERHFTSPKVISPCFRYKKLPRKLKKTIDKILIKHTIHIDVDINTKLWYCLDFTNPEYKKFLIKQICKNN